MCTLISEYRLPREVLPTELLQQARVWEALLEQMPMTAMIRNLATLTRMGVLTPMSAWTKTVAERLHDRDWLCKARIHPVQVLAALKTYAGGCGVRGQRTWTPVRQVVDALDAAFYLCFDNVQPTGMRILLAVDVSGSMASGSIGGVPGLTPRDGAAALALVTAAREENSHIVGFTNGLHSGPVHGMCGSGLTAFADQSRASGSMRVENYMAFRPFGGTGSALPMVSACRRAGAVDSLRLADNETSAGDIHPAQALRDYREQMALPARLIVVGMTSNGFTIGDPNDAGTLNVVGFSPEVPNLISDFIRGEL